MGTPRVYSQPAVLQVLDLEAPYPVVYGNHRGSEWGRMCLGMVPLERDSHETVESYLQRLRNAVESIVRQLELDVEVACFAAPGWVRPFHYTNKEIRGHFEVLRWLPDTHAARRTAVALRDLNAEVRVAGDYSLDRVERGERFEE